MSKELFFRLWNDNDLREYMLGFAYPNRKSAKWYDYKDGSAAIINNYTALINERALVYESPVYFALRFRRYNLVEKFIDQTDSLAIIWAAKYDLVWLDRLCKVSREAANQALRKLILINDTDPALELIDRNMADNNALKLAILSTSVLRVTLAEALADNNRLNHSMIKYVAVNKNDDDMVEFLAADGCEFTELELDDAIYRGRTRTIHAMLLTGARPSITVLRWARNNLDSDVVEILDDLVD